MRKKITIEGMVEAGSVISTYYINPDYLVTVATIVFCILLIVHFWNRISNRICKLALSKCPNIRNLKDDLKESQQTVAQTKDDLVFIVSKILPLSLENKEFLIGKYLAQHVVHLSFILNNNLGFHIEIESMIPKIKIDGWELKGKYQVSNLWQDIYHCLISVDQTITPMVTDELRQKEVDEITLGCDLVLNIWFKDANIRSQARYSF